MIGTVRFHRHTVLLSRAPTRQRDPLSPLQSRDLALAQMIRRLLPATPPLTMIPRLCSPGSADQAAIIT
jgi:hypothetical protein